jgi:DNA replication protein DnaC
MNVENLEDLINTLKLKITADLVSDDSRPAVIEFLKSELEFRIQHQIKQLFSKCGMTEKQKRSFCQFDWDFNPNIPKNDIMIYKNAILKKEAHNLVLIGDTGIGKTHVAKALCLEVMLKGLSAYFVTAFDLISRIKKAPIPASKIDYYGSRIYLLCIDELGYTFHKKEDTDIIFQIISKRSEMLPTLITTNLTPKEWGTLFSGAAATTILDRLSYHGLFLNWEGTSYRPQAK